MSMQTDNSQNALKPQLNDTERKYYTPQDSPVQTYNRYIEWLCQPIYDPNIDLFTEGTRKYLNSVPFSPAYLDHILFNEYGQSFKIVERGGLAMLYFTSTPFVSPYIFVKENEKWKMDILASIQIAKEVTGGIYTWTYVGQDDQYTKCFRDLLINIQGYVRIKDGDNRALVIRGSKGL